MSLLLKREINIVLEEANTLINVYDSRKLLDYGRSFSLFSDFNHFKKDSRVCTYCNWSYHTIDVCYHKHGFPPNFGKKKVYVNASNVSISDAQHLIRNCE